MRLTYQNNILSASLFEIEKCISDILSDCACDFKNKLIGAIFYNNCHSIIDNTVERWPKYLLNCKVEKEKLVKIGKAINQLRKHTYKIPLQQTDPLRFQSLPVRLKGQEILHFNGRKCTDTYHTGDDGLSDPIYTGDDGDPICILDKFERGSVDTKSLHPLPFSLHALPFHQTSQYGYREMSFNLLEPQVLYTLMLQPCIAILMVGIKSNGTVKAALMHEDYSSAENSVTNMFKHSFQSELKDFNKLKIFLIGGNGGEEYTRNRFTIHRSEISQLQEQHGGLINFNLSTDSLDSPNDQFKWDQSNVFFTSLESSSYLWILQSSELGCSVERICVSGPELSLEKLVLYYQERILPLLHPSQIRFKEFVDK